MTKPASRNLALMVAYTATIFLSATLLFLVQPMFARMVLPLLGGTPAVWNTCMVFFQATLLLGYLYAHLTTRWLSLKRQACLHLVVMLLPLALLPISVPVGLQANRQSISEAHPSSEHGRSPQGKVGSLHSEASHRSIGLSSWAEQPYQF